MSALEMAMQMWPMWMLGFFMLYVTFQSGNKDLLRVEFPKVLKWVKLLCLISVVRFGGFYLLWDQVKSKFVDVSWLPVETTSMVWWEDAAHTLPLLLLARLIGTEKKTWWIHGLAILLISVSFGSGHIYQGIGAVIALTFYIPFTYKLSKEIGLGTIMIGHVLYDAATLLLIQTMLRYM